jgi:hypothetical protein
MMKPYIDGLKAHTAECNRQSEEQAKKQRKPPDTRVLCEEPLTDQIEALQRTLSPAQFRRPFTMEEMCARLKGRYSTRPHPMNVGQALRSKGWTQRRDWSRDGDGRRYWFPPILEAKY